MTERELQAIEVRLLAAAPGPWQLEVNDSRLVGADGSIIHYDFAWPMEEPRKVANLALILHAPVDLAALIAEVRRLSSRPPTGTTD